MLTKRDKNVINFITNMPCYSTTINKLFFNSQRYCNHRLSNLYDYGYIKRSRKYASEFFFYWAGKGKREPADKHKMHYDLIARAYWWILKQEYNIISLEVQKQIEKVKPDLLVKIEKGGRTNILPIEIERNDIERTVRKYEDTEFHKLLLFSQRSFEKETTVEVVNIRLNELY